VGKKQHKSRTKAQSPSPSNKKKLAERQKEGGAHGSMVEEVNFFFLLHTDHESMLRFHNGSLYREKVTF